MTDTAKPTPGPWYSSGTDVKPLGNRPFICWTGTPERYLDEARANAALIAEAGTVFHETGLTPRQLLEQRDELVELLESYLRILRHHMHALTADDQTIENCLFDGKKALAKCRKGQTND
jgi:hypothetical protein